MSRVKWPRERCRDDQRKKMNEITCPHCTKDFKIDEAGYADILKQVRDRDFEQQLNERLELAERDKNYAVQLATTQVTADKDSLIQELKAKLDASEIHQKLALSEAVRAIESERDQLKTSLDHLSLTKQLSEKSIQEKYEVQIKDRDDMIERLRDLKSRLSTKMVGETLE
jgi:hypothetical protein